MTFIRTFLLGAVATSLTVLVNAATPRAPGFDLLDSMNTAFSYTAKTDLRRGAGEISVQRYEFDASGRTTLSPETAFSHGFGLVRTELDHLAASLLPSTLQELSLRLGWHHQGSEKWRFNASVRPGFFGDRSSLDWDTFNAPFLGLASYAASRRLIWSFGFIANAFADNPVLPVAGVRWQFAPSWLLNLTYPRAGVAWELDSSTTLTAGATFQGGAYRLTRNPAGPGTATLTGTELDYREIRVGVGGSFKLSTTLTLTVDVGVTVDQRFEYHERGIEQQGDATGFGAIALSGRF